MNRLHFPRVAMFGLLLLTPDHCFAWQDVGGIHPTLQVEEEESGPVELLFLFSVQSDVKKLLQLGDEVSQIVGSNEWQEDDLLFSIVSDTDLRKFVQTPSDTPCRIQYDIYLTAPISGSAEYSQAVAFAAPITLLSDEDAMGIDIAKAEPDGEGFATMDENSDHFLMLREDDMAFIFYIEEDTFADERKLLLQMRDQFRRNPPAHAFEISASPQRIRRSLRQPFADMAIASLSTALQQRDGEDAMTFRNREFWGKSIAELIDVVANQLETIRYAVDQRTAEQGVQITLALEAKQNSAFAEWLKRQRKARSSTIRYLHPEASFSCLMNLALPEVMQETLPPLADAAAETLADYNLVSASAVSEIKSAVQNLASQGRLELLLQVVPDGAGRHCAVICVPLHESPGFSNAAIELVSLVQEAGVVLAQHNIDGFPVHQYPMDEEDLLPHADLIQFVATDTALMFYVGPRESEALLSQVVRTDFDRHPESDLWHRKGFIAHTSLTSLMRIIGAADDDDFRVTYLGNLDESVISNSDTISVVLQHDENVVELSATFDRFASAMGMAAFSGAFTIALEGLNF